MEKNSLKKAYEFKKKPKNEEGVWDKVKGGFKEWYDWNMKERPKPIK
jgi:hypothetical protein